MKTLTRRQKKWGIITTSIVVVLLLIITFLPMVVRKVAVSQIAAACIFSIAQGELLTVNSARA